MPRDADRPPHAARCRARAPHAAVLAGARRQRQKEIDASIARHAEYRVPATTSPTRSAARVRVTGPFTVESLSPHRVLRRRRRRRAARRRWPTKPVNAARAAPTRGRMPDARLRHRGARQPPAPACRTREERAHHVRHPQALARQSHHRRRGRYHEDDGQKRRAAIVIGPEYGTVGRRPRARRRAGGARRRLRPAGRLRLRLRPARRRGHHGLGRLTVLKARMNPTCTWATSCKKPGAGNLFTVFGEPDIESARAAGRHVSR